VSNSDRVDLGQAVRRLETELASNGYKVKKSHACHLSDVTDRQFTITGTNTERGVRFKFMVDTQADPKYAYVDVDVHVRDCRGRMVKPERSWRCRSIKVNSDLGEAVSWVATMRGAEVTDPILRNKADLYPPLRFTKPFVVLGNCDGKQKSKIDHVFANCVVEKIVTINDDLSVVDSLDAPGQDCWLLVGGFTAKRESGASPEIIVSLRDGELVYYPIRHRRIIDEFQPKNTKIDYLAFTELDRILIDHAVQRFLEKV
jgi:hypothetical protein